MSRALVLDTNVLVSAALKPDSDVASIVEKVLLRQTPVYVCASILAEYRDVLNRPKFRSKGFPPAWLPRLLQVAFHEPEPAPWPLNGPDSDDLVFLALAKATGAVLVTGNLGDFPEAIRDGVEVRSPGAYLAGPAGSS
jgi:predicted nucleic acid-binding protein